MPKPKKGPRLGGSPAHQRLIVSNLATQLFEHGRITTTEAKARVLRPVAEKLITKAKRGDLHNRREVLKTVRDKSRRARAVHRDRAAVRRAPGRLHPDHQDRSAQGRQRPDGGDRAGDRGLRAEGRPGCQEAAAKKAAAKKAEPPRGGPAEETPAEETAEETPAEETPEGLRRDRARRPPTEATEEPESEESDKA